MDKRKNLEQKLYPGGISLLLSSRPFTPVNGEVSSPPGLRFPALTTPGIKGDPAVPGRLRSPYRSELLLGGPPPRSHDIISRAEGVVLLFVERKSNQWLFDECPLLSAGGGGFEPNRQNEGWSDFHQVGRLKLA